MREPNDVFMHHETIDANRFDEDMHPQVIAEVTRLHRSLAKIQSRHKGKIIISSLMGETIKTEWLDGSKELILLLTSGFLPAPHLYALLSSCKGNAIFTKDVEAYITAKLAR
jgi:hypothetical protein